MNARATIVSLFEATPPRRQRRPKAKAPDAASKDDLGSAEDLKSELLSDPGLYRKVLAYLNARPAYINASVDRIGHHYVHANTVKFSTETGDFVDETTGEQTEYDAEIENLVVNELEDDLTEWVRDVSNAIYEALEAEYEYQTSDEQIADTLTANDYLFTEDGDEGGTIPVNQLDDRVKQRVIDEHRNWNVDDNYWSEYIIEEWKEWLENQMGCNDVKINYSGFWSQGDGASFTAKSVDIAKLLTQLADGNRMPEWARN